MRKIFISVALLLGITSMHAQNWSLSGNSGASGSFLGTTDNNALRFKVNNNNSGFVNPSSNSTAFGQWALDYSWGDGNTAFGSSVLARNTSGIQNTAMGLNSLINNKTGHNNVAIGAWTMVSNMDGYFNTAIGTNALYSNTSGFSNTGVGFSALNKNTTGLHNTALGYEALIVTAGANLNTAVGSKAMHSNTTGWYNAAVGSQSMELNTTGQENAAFGPGALYSNTTGSKNTAIGSDAGWSNISGAENTSVGNEALAGSIDGSWNIAVGTRALWSTHNASGDPNISGGDKTYGYGHYSNNTIVGYEAMRDATTGGNNTALGLKSLITNKSGSNNVAIGMNANVSQDGLNNTTAIGTGAIATASNQMRFGNSSVTSIGGTVNWSVLSDGRIKKNIQKNVPGLSFINQLQPVTYNYDYVTADKITNMALNNDSQSEKARATQQKIQYTGFIAQDVEKAAKSINYNFSGVDTPKNENDLYSLRYGDFVVPLVKAVQELSEENEILRKEVSELKALVEKALAGKTTDIGTKSVSLSQTVPSVLLEQNVPNPFTQNTTIRYKLPQKFYSAKITITDMNGRSVKQIPLATSDNGAVNIEAGSLVAGTYLYSLIVDDNLIDTKKMILSK